MTEEAKRPALDLAGLGEDVAGIVRPFLDAVLDVLGSEVISIALVREAVTDDFRPGSTEIDSAIFLRRVDVSLLHQVAPLGRKYGRKGIGAPYILTPEYLERSRDVFPLEFLEMKLAHRTVAGEDLLSKIEIPIDHLRLQVERELKAFLLHLGQGFLRAAGDRRTLGALLEDAAAGLFPEMRALLHLLEKPIAHVRAKDLVAVSEAAGVDASAVRRVLLPESSGERFTLEEAEARFAALHEFVTALSERADALLG